MRCGASSIYLSISFSAGVKFVGGGSPAMLAISLAAEMYEHHAIGHIASSSLFLSAYIAYRHRSTYHPKY